MQAKAGRSRGTLWRRLRKRLRQDYVKLLRSPGAPREVAGGMALGLFVSMLPVLQMPVAVGGAELARRVFGRPLSRVAAVLGVWFTNPLTAAPLYGLSLLAGRPLARAVLPEQFVSEAGTRFALSLSTAGPYAVELFTALLIGGTMLGLPLAFVGYRLTLALVVSYQARRLRRRAQKVAPPPAGAAVLELPGVAGSPRRVQPQRASA